MSKLKKSLILCSIVGTMIFLPVASNSVFADAGSEEDPVVTLSYVEKRLEQIRYYIDQKISEILGIQTKNTEDITVVKEDVSKLKTEDEEVKKQATENKAYVDYLKNEKERLETEVAEVKAELEIVKTELESVKTQEVKSEGKLSVVELKAGQSLKAEDGAQIILRSGEATSIGSELGGLSDITTGEDIAGGQAVTKNHMLIVPRNDGRGIYAKTDVWVMIIGKYEIN